MLMPVAGEIIEVLVEFGEFLKTGRVFRWVMIGIQDGFIESWDYSNFEEYGVEAVGALIR